MATFEQEGKKYWKDFGGNEKKPAMLFFDFVNPDDYSKALSNYDLQGNKVINIAAGYPVPKEFPGKNIFPATEIYNVLRKKGAKIISVDVARKPLTHQKNIGNESVIGDAFQLPFRDESIDGGAIISNLFNASIPGIDYKEIIISPHESNKIISETYRVLKEKKFAIINNYYTQEYLNLSKLTGPEDSEMITSEQIEKQARSAGFRHIESIPLDYQRLNTGYNYIYRNKPRSLGILPVEFKNSFSILLEK
jgi:hypothetical protein